MKVLFIVLILLLSFTTKAQQLAYSDPAAAYNRILLEKGAGNYLQIGNYKVMGTQYVYGGSLDTDLYAEGNTEPKKVKASYDTYKKKLDVVITNSSKTMEINNVDSFILYNPNEMADKYINCKYIQPNLNGYITVVSVAPKCTLYKYYETTLATPTDNYINAELRVFQLDYTYYYKVNGSKDLIKLNLAYKNLQKQLKEHVDVAGTVDRETYNQNYEDGLKRIMFAYK